MYLASSVAGPVHAVRRLRELTQRNILLSDLSEEGFERDLKRVKALNRHGNCHDYVNHMGYVSDMQSLEASLARLSSPQNESHYWRGDIRSIIVGCCFVENLNMAAFNVFDMVEILLTDPFARNRAQSTEKHGGAMCFHVGPPAPDSRVISLCACGKKGHQQSLGDLLSDSSALTWHPLAESNVMMQRLMTFKQQCRPTSGPPSDAQAERSLSEMRNSLLEKENKKMDERALEDRRQRALREMKRLGFLSENAKSVTEKKIDELFEHHTDVNFGEVDEPTELASLDEKIRVFLVAIDAEEPLRSKPKPGQRPKTSDWVRRR